MTTSKEVLLARFSRLVEAGIQLEMMLIDNTVELTHFEPTAARKKELHKQTKQVQEKLRWINGHISRIEKQLQS